MKTLIIHPKDPSTDFLKTIYEDIAEKTVITRGVTKKSLSELIFNHDRILMMGHGSPNGLFSVGQFITNNYYIIDESMVELLKQTENNVFIWCYASDFTRKHHLDGFCTGMFISEPYEAIACGISPNIFGPEDVNESNKIFCEILKSAINKSTDEIYDIVLKQYGVLANTNPIARYNYNLIVK